MDERRTVTLDRRLADRRTALSEMRVVIEAIAPQIDDGRFAPKRTPGEPVHVGARIFADGHDVLRAIVADRPAAPGGTDAGAWRATDMTLVSPGTDHWRAAFTVSQPGWHLFRLAAWVDRFQTWRRDLRIKSAAGQRVTLELLEGALLVREAAERAIDASDPAVERAASAADRQWLLLQADLLSDSGADVDRVGIGLSGDLDQLMRRYPDQRQATVSPVLRVWVDRARARVGAWYEFFPRSASPDPARSGTLREAMAWLPRIADLGFDVVYLPPIHPIGRRFRKGRNNRLTAADDDPGSPWAIGSPAGGHDAVDPGLGTIADFVAFRGAAERLGLEVALDLAWQCSPDHPWVTEHPEWFRHRPDGTIAYAENPPKRYQDIYPLDFAGPAWRELWRALLDVTLFWVGHGVRIFRVDNPHTKSLPFWEWLIREVQSRDPGVLFLSEAFTRPAVMRYLAKAGFTQSYTYFTWRNTKAELIDYLAELTQSESAEYLRPNLFANTPDILHAYLQEGGRPAFEARLVLAATLAATYGIYSGFELCEGRAVPGTEEYLDSEKYQIRQWDWNRPGHIQELVCRVNHIRRTRPALQFNDSLRFHDTDNPALVAYSKADPDGRSLILVVVNLDPRYMQHGYVRVPLDRLEQPADLPYPARDLLTGVRYDWRGEWNYVRLDPGIRQAHIIELRHP